MVSSCVEIDMSENVDPGSLILHLCPLYDLKMIVDASAGRGRKQRRQRLSLDSATAMQPLKGVKAECHSPTPAPRSLTPGRSSPGPHEPPHEPSFDSHQSPARRSKSPRSRCVIDCGAPPRTPEARGPLKQQNTQTPPSDPPHPLRPSACDSRGAQVQPGEWWYGLP